MAVRGWTCSALQKLLLPQLLVSLHILLTLASSVLSYSHFIEENSPGDSAISLQKMTLDTDTNMLYVGSVNRLYKLNSDLVEQVHMDIGPVQDHPTCLPPPNFCTDPDYGRVETNNINKILLIDRDQHRLITCGSVFQGTCQLRSLDDFAVIANNTAQEIATNTEVGTTVGFIARGPVDGENVLYAASSHANWLEDNVPTISSRKLPASNTDSTLFDVLKIGGYRKVSQIIIPEQTIALSPNGFNITYVYGFASGSFSYFVAVQPKNHMTIARQVEYYTKLVRICQNDLNYRSYIELPLECRSGSTLYNVAQSAYISRANRTTGQVWQTEDTLFVTFAQSVANQRDPQPKSAVCMYRIRDLNLAFVTRRKQCANGESENTEIEWYKSSLCTQRSNLVEQIEAAGENYCHILDVIEPMGGLSSPIRAEAIYVNDSSLFTAITTSHKTRDSAVFVGDNTGHLRKLRITSQNEAKLSREMEIVASSPVTQNGLLFNIDEEYVYVMTQRQITKVPVEECEDYTTCEECLVGPNNVGDPYCGWCTLQKRCTRWGNAVCAGSESETARRWLGWRDACIDIQEVTPPNTPMNRRQVLDLTVASLPQLEVGEQYECVFGEFGRERATVDFRDNSSMVQCNTPPLAQIPDRAQGSEQVKLGIFSSETSKEIISTDFVFYKCAAFSGCMQCVDNAFDCGWCVFDNVCQSRTEACNTSQVPGNRVTSPELCPRIFNETEILIPVGVERDYRVSAANLPGSENLPGGRPISYKCVLDYEGREVSVPATRLSDSLLECHSETYTYETDADELPVVLSVQWNENFKIDNPSGFTVNLYKCSVNRPNCGICVSANPRYQCGWCESTKECSIDDHCTNWFAPGDLCPSPIVTSFTPRAGPVEGDTRLTIRGINLGQTDADIHNISVAGQPCVPIPETYITASEIVCMTERVDKPRSGPIVVTIANSNESEIGQSEEDFAYVFPKIIAHAPILGPASGGTRVTITGFDLDAASNITAMLANQDCLIDSVSRESVVCITSAASIGDSGFVGMRFDGSYVEGTLMYTYNPDPTIESVKRFHSIRSGGLAIKVTGTNLNVIQKPQMVFRLQDQTYIANCTVDDNSMGMTCYTPNVSASSIPLPHELSKNNYGFILDGVKNFTNLANLAGVQPFTFVSDPVYKKFDEPDHLRKFSYGQPKQLTIQGENLTLAYEENDVTVRIGNYACKKILLAAATLSCDAPEEQPESERGELYPSVVVQHGNLEFYIGKLHYEPKEIPWILIIGAAAGSLLALIIFLLTLVVYCRKANANERLVKQLEQQRDALELRVAKECKEAFAELQTNVNTVTSDLGCGIPFHSYHIYAMKTMFPDQPNHPVLKELPLPNDRKTNLERALQMFGQLIDNKTFLLCLIQTLEEQRSFHLRDVSSVASLLMVVLQSKMDYATDIMKVLLTRLIEKHLEKDRARLLMRRNESVAEKMVSNWLSFLLYNFMVESAGEPLFTLFYGIKQQVEMGPVDAITGEARYGLSEVKIIRQTIENRTLTIYAMGLDKDADPIQVKVHTCDSISQVKEKILDAIYRTTPYSHRPPKEELDLEWRCGLQGRKILPEDTGPVDGEWKRLTMLSDEQVRDGDTIALVPKQGFTMSAFTAPTTGRYTSPCRSTTPMLGSSDVENGLKLWHLVKQSDHENIKGNEKDHKMMAEIYLPRLLTTKVTLQKFVDDLFETIFSVNYRSNTLPRAIKYLFDFFDDQAKQHGIANPEVVHSWKSNSLPLRFWVNLIKNPDHIFDIYKSDTVDACLSIVGQCLMDACSVSEHQLTKDSPSSKLLYAKDIPKYKEWVARYYEDIKNMPPISDQDMNSVLAEHSNTHQYDFHTLSALNELYHTYTKKYSDQLSESLQRDEFALKYKLAEKFDHVEQLLAEEDI